MDDNPSTITSGSGDENATPPVATQPQPQASTAAAPAAAPANHGILDRVLGALVGSTGAPQITHDANGNATVTHPPLTHGQQWLRVAGEAIRGAAAGYAAGPGPAGKVKALEAGIESTDRVNAQRGDADRDAKEEARQQNLDLFNSVKLKHDIAAQEFALSRMKTVATQQDVEFAQKQIDREHALGSADLGVYKDEAHLAEIKKVNPNFWKDVYANNVVTVPELGENGERQGLHVFLRTPGMGSQLVEPGTPIKIFTPGKNPGDMPTLTEQTPNIPMTHDQKDTYDNAAASKYQKWLSDKLEMDLKSADIGEKKAQGKRIEDITPSEISRNRAEAAKDNAEANKTRGEIEQGQADAQLAMDIYRGNVVPEKIGLMLTKPSGQAVLAAASRLAEANGHPLDMGKLQSYPKLVIDYTSGKRGQQLTNLNTAFNTINQLNDLNTWGSRVPFTEAERSFNAKLTNVAPEIANGLAKPGVAATKDEISQVKEALAVKANRAAAIHSQVGSLIEQYRSFRNGWFEGSPSDMFHSKMPEISPEAQDVIRKFDPQSADVWFGKPVVVNGKVIGYTKDGTNVIPRRVTQ